MLPCCWRDCVQGQYLNIETAKKKLEKIAWKWCKSVDNIFWLLKKCPIFSVFCIFLHKETSVWHYLYIFVKIRKGATTFVNRAKQVAMFLVPWEFWPKKEIGGSFMEHAVMFLNVVTNCDQLSLILRNMQNHLFLVLFCGFPNEKYIWSHDFSTFRNV